MSWWVAKRKNMCDGRYWYTPVKGRVGLADGSGQPCSCWPSAEMAHLYLRAANIEGEYELIELVPVEGL